MMSIRLTLLISFASCLIGSPVLAASSAWVENGPNRLRIVIAEPQPGESDVRAVLDIDLAPGWKTYWQDPGDAGVPLQFSLDGSENAAEPLVKYPVPKRFDDGVTVWAGYDQPVQMPIVVKRPVPDKAGILKASVFLGVCEDICVPVQASFSVPFGDGQTNLADTFLVDQAHARLPAPADTQNEILAVTMKDKELEVTAVMNGAAPTELFLAAPKGWQFGAPIVTRTDGLQTTFAAKVLYQADKAATDPLKLDYTVSNGKAAVSGTEEFSPR